jgi:mannose-6-phosphate isomerase-like protein (cupin superfamily)
MNRYFASILTFVLILMVSAASAQQDKPTWPMNTDTPEIGHNDPSQYNVGKNAHDGAGELHYFTLLAGEVMTNNYLFYHRGWLMGKSGIGEHIHRTMEEMYVIFDGVAEFTVNGETSLLPAGSMVLCPLGSSHAILNPNDTKLEWMNIGVSVEKGKYDAVNYGDSREGVRLESPPPFKYATFDRSLLRPAKNAHHGKGTILFRRLWDNDDFATNWYFVDHCILPKDTSIGYHQHNTIEEVYYVINGTGRYTVNDKTYDVRPGDALPCRLHDVHGLYNNSDDDLEIMVVSVAEKKGFDKWSNEYRDTLEDR